MAVAPVWAVWTRLDGVLFRYSPHAKACLQAALATVLGIKPAIVPDFMAGTEPGNGSGRAAFDAMERWLETLGLYPHFEAWGTLGGSLAAGEDRLWILLAGPMNSPPGSRWGHAYVCHGGRIVWCPDSGEDPPAGMVPPEPTTGSYWNLNIFRYSGP